jgi:HAD superfamily hydrolase (TIGR01484 family)
MAHPDGVRALVACDLDGTVLEDDGTPVPGIVAALAELVSCGAALVVCTGRPLHAARSATGALGVDPAAYACYHGALVVSGAGELLRHLPLPRDTARAVAAEAMRHGLGVTVYDYDAPRELATGGGAGQEPGDDVSRLVLHGGPEAAVRLLQRLKVAWGDSVRFEPIRPGYLGVFHRRADKADALRMLARYLGVPQDRVAACGDSATDESLLAAAAVRIAVGDRPHVLGQVPGVVVTSRAGLAETLIAGVLPLLGTP